MSSSVTSQRIDGIRSRFRQYSHVRHIIDAVQAKSTRTEITGLIGSSTAFTVDALSTELQRPVIVISSGGEQSRNLYEDLLFLLGESAVALYPARQILPYDFKAPVGEIIGRRISTLDRLLSASVKVVVTDTRALLEPAIDKKEFEKRRVSLAKGKEVDLDDLVRRLLGMGFRRSAVVEEVGDFAVRGGLIDFFSPGHDAPVRVELFGDEIESIRHFDVSSQRSMQKLDSVSLLPRRETPITHETLEEYISKLPQADAEYLRERYHNDPELPGLEWLSIAFGLPQGTLTEYFPENAFIFFDGKDDLAEQAAELFGEAREIRNRLSQHLKSLPQPEDYYRPLADIQKHISHHASVVRLPFRGGKENVIDFACQPHPALGSRLDLLGESLTQYKKANTHIIIATDTDGQKARLGDLLAERVGEYAREYLDVADLSHGFVCAGASVALLTDHEIFGRYHRRTRKKKFREGVAIADYSSLTRGDYVVHTDYGVARYLGLETIVVDKRHRDCLLLQYAGTDRLFVPIEEFNRVSKYAGKETAPELTALGGAAWEKLKEKTKKAIAEMAEDLIGLYAERKARPGFAFGEDSVWLKQLEASFIYEETPDQQKAILDVKRDLMSTLPMDRLVCGDVGFGKTEVAIRAAFKAVENGKQVAVLVPTTVLAQQHFLTFSTRFADYPVRVESLSRFRSRKQQLETLGDLAIGKVEVVIGTHRLLSADVHFKDLGLLIVDEEHRFGVKHKERIRQLKRDVDTLAMSATPIPRTLQMALSGIRDMSMITTSPKDRLPINTEIVEFEPNVLASAVMRELDRGGQVFFVHNRVQTIETMKEYLSTLVPKAKVAIAHGQMHERSLEGIMLAFLAKQFDVLLCTSIIESGLDIPNANTIIINRADRFGLAQLYQIRGRVGRSSQRAYAYMVVPPVKQLRPDAVKRLHAIEAHSHLGAGFALAMRDLEIRGAGELLGARQSGYIEEIGYDLYNRLLEEAVARLKGTILSAPIDTKLEVDLELFLSDEYVSDRQQKVDIYRRLADANEFDQVGSLRNEVTDRFGRLPQSAMNLFDAALVKIAAAKLRIEKVKLINGKASFFFTEGRTLTRPEVEGMRKATDVPMDFSFLQRTQVNLDVTKLSFEHRLGILFDTLASALANSQQSSTVIAS